MATWLLPNPHEYRGFDASGITIAGSLSEVNGMLSCANGAVVPIPTWPDGSIVKFWVRLPPFSRVKNFKSPDACPLEFLPEDILALSKVSVVVAVNTNATDEVDVASFCNLNATVSFPESVFLTCNPSLIWSAISTGLSNFEIPLTWKLTPVSILSPVLIPNLIPIPLEVAALSTPKNVVWPALPISCTVVSTSLPLLSFLSNNDNFVLLLSLAELAKPAIVPLSTSITPCVPPSDATVPSKSNPYLPDLISNSSSSVSSVKIWYNGVVALLSNWPSWSTAWASASLPLIWILPATSKDSVGSVTPIPTLPVSSNLTLSEPAVSIDIWSVVGNLIAVFVSPVWTILSTIDKSPPILASLVTVNSENVTSLSKPGLSSVVNTDDANLPRSLVVIVPPTFKSRNKLVEERRRE